MKAKLSALLTALVTLLAFNSHATVRYVDLTCTNPTPPFLDWTTAATNIQDAIDASVNGDQILVTNGIYQVGGKVMAGDLTNRVALDKAVRVQSVNGPWATSIRGSGAVSGTAAVRCAWLTNGAALIGFALQGGATRISGDTQTLASGGGVWCASSNASVVGCVIFSNTAASYGYGGGVFRGTINSSLICSNFGVGMGCAAYGANLSSCTVISNAAWNSGYYALWSCWATNCIVYYNSPYCNYYSDCVLSYCCTTPAPPKGTGNFTAAPQLFADEVHLLPGSPCIGAGTNFVTGTDIFGLAWSNPPSVGCAEWNPAPLVMAPQLKLTSDPVGFMVGGAAVGGQPPLTLWWLKDGTPLQDNGHLSGTQTTNLVAVGVAYADAGNYQLVVSNAFGVVTSSVAPLVGHCVDAGSVAPLPPYATWTTAATNIQDAITAALPNEVVLVTNGLYASGGKSMDGVITNRVSLDKALLVASVNGPYATTIQGAVDPVSTNGPAAVRCAWLTNKAILSGFTLCGGATRPSGQNQPRGGGVWGNSTSATLDHCLVLSNYSAQGGGAYQVTLNHCSLIGNRALGSGSGGGAATCNLKNCVITANAAEQDGGGAWNCNLTNCSVTKNSSYLNGGGVRLGMLVNCTITGNTSGFSSVGYGGAAYGATLTNCIIWGNLQMTSFPYTNYASCTLAYCCADPLATGPGNMALDPQLLADGVHLASTSPCRGAGTSGVVTGADIDDQPWNTPPAIGCDEWQPTPVFAGPPICQANAPLQRLELSVSVAGQPPFTYWWSKDGVPLQDDGHYSNSTAANPTVQRFGPEHAGSYQVVVSNAFGVITSQVAQVVIHAVDAANANPVPPYASWSTAAATIQDAVDASSAGDIVLVTDGIYASGGKVMAGDLTNRVALDKPLTVTSANGAFLTVIQGAWDPVSTNGPGAVRCAWVTNGAVLNGFTLCNGATRASDGWTGSRTTSGGGVWCSSTDAAVSNCVLTNNSAVYGGGISYGTLKNSLLLGNHATAYGGGAYAATLNNCTVVNNSGPVFSGYGAGTYNCVVRNSIVTGNYCAPPHDFTLDNYAYGFNYSLAKYVYSYTYPAISGTGNLSGPADSPGFLDLFHISSTSPHVGAGSALYASGADLDGEPWANPPSMGCDEVVLANLVGPLSVNLLAWRTNVLVTQLDALARHWDTFWGTIAGRAARVEWNYGDGPTQTTLGTSTMKVWTNPGDYTVTFTAFNTDNPGGVSTNVLVHVTVPRQPQLQALTLVSNTFGFQFAGELDANYTVQYTTNLVPPVTWQTLQSYYWSPDQVYQITDPVLTNGNRFYRVLAQ